MNPALFKRILAAGAVLVLAGVATWLMRGQPAPAVGKLRAPPVANAPPRQLQQHETTKQVQADAGPTLRTPGPLPPIQGPIAAPIGDGGLAAPIARLESSGSVGGGTAQTAAEVLWQALRRCGATLSGPIDADFALLAGLEVGQSGLHELHVAGTSAEVAACLAKTQAELRTPVVSDTAGKVTVQFAAPPR